MCPSRRRGELIPCWHYKVHNTVPATILRYTSNNARETNATLGKSGKEMSIFPQEPELTNKQKKKTPFVNKKKRQRYTSIIVYFVYITASTWHRHQRSSFWQYQSKQTLETTTPNKKRQRCTAFPSLPAQVP